MNSDIITAFLPKTKHSNLSQPVNFTIQHKKVNRHTECASTHPPIPLYLHPCIHTSIHPFKIFYLHPSSSMKRYQFFTLCFFATSEIGGWPGDLCVLGRERPDGREGGCLHGRGGRGQPLVGKWLLGGVLR